MVIRQNCFRVKHQGWKGVVCAFGGSVASRRLRDVLSHSSILLPWLVGCCTSRCAQGGGQGAEETSQQCETKTPPGTKHRPAIAMANVLREAIHVAGVAG